MMSDWEGRRVAITGATGGVGAELARALAPHARLLLMGRRVDMLDALAEELVGAATLRVDLADAGSRARACEEIASFGADSLIHNAGIQYALDFVNQSADEVARDAAHELEVDLTAPITMTARALTPLSRHAEALGRAGRVVFVTSGLALAPKEGAPVYCAAKAGLRQFALALGYQLQTSGAPLTSHEVLLPLVDTPMTAGRGRGKIPADQAARALLEGVGRGRSEVYVGKTRLLRVLMRVSPMLARRVMRGM
jgi:uncharacterized oxidoreductase